MPTLAVFPGSFDPLTNGHVDIITRGTRLFDRIVVAILVNAEKQPLFSMEERVEIARAVFKDMPSVEVDTTPACSWITSSAARRTQLSAVCAPCPTSSTSSRWP
jgi:pantetheine-phosphate adenylyltransferase